MGPCLIIAVSIKAQINLTPIRRRLVLAHRKLGVYLLTVSSPQHENKESPNNTEPTNFRPLSENLPSALEHHLQTPFTQTQI